MGSNRQRGVVLIAGIAGVTLLLAGCSSSPGGPPKRAGSGAAQPIQVVAAENFWGDITEQIGGSSVRVTSVISDPAADPHEYQSNLTDAAALGAARLVIVNGAGYDDFMGELLSAQANSTRAVVDIGELVHVSGSNPNPHLWYDPSYVDTAAGAIEKALADADPAHAATYAANLARFRAAEQAQVGDVIAEIRTKYDGAPIAYTERVAGYLLDAAGLRLATPTGFSQAIEQDRDPSPADNAAFEAAITGRKVKVLLYNGQVTDAETTHLKQLANTSGVPVVPVTETMPPDAANFQTWQGDQARALLAALGLSNPGLSNSGSSNSGG